MIGLVMMLFLLSVWFIVFKMINFTEKGQKYP